jgi:hypothetical protein
VFTPSTGPSPGTSLTLVVGAFGVGGSVGNNGNGAAGRITISWS